MESKVLQEILSLGSYVYITFSSQNFEHLHKYVVNFNKNVQIFPLQV